jgi:uncharacterized protein YdeI (YjbR/CyaY-like superfamily)
MTTSSEVDAHVERSERWSDEIAALRPVLIRCGLVEEVKWAKPCYTHDGRNIVIVQEMRDFLGLMFFKGALLTNPHGLLEDQGPNSRSARRIRITSVDDVLRFADMIADHVRDAVEVERSGRRLDPAPDLQLVDELQTRLDADPALRAAFDALTPGRRREYNMFVSGAKASSTRALRIEKHVQRILDGKGLRDR